MKKIKLNQLKIGAVISYVAMAVSIVMGLIYTPWMVSSIGKENYGLYTLATSLINIFMLDFGLGSAVSRFVSKYRAEKNQEGINNILGIIFKLYVAIDAVVVVIFAVLFFFLGSIYTKLTPAEIEQFRVLYVMVAGFHLVSFPFAPLNGILNAHEKFIQLKICDLVSKFSTVLFVVLALSFSANVVSVVFANIASGLLVILIKLIIVKTQVPIRINFKAGGKDLYKTLFAFTLWTTIISIMQRFTHSFAPSVLGMTSSSVEIALYAPAVTLEAYFYTLATAINGMFLPRVSKYIADKKEENILKLMINVGRYQMVILGLVFIGFVCVGKEFMTLWMGPDYTKTYYCTMIILFPTLISCTQQIAKTAVIAKKLINYQAICMTITGTLGLTLSYVLSMYIGALGVCIGTAVTSLANIVYMNFIYKRKAGINVFTFYKKAYLTAIPYFVITLALGLIIAYYVSIQGWLGLAIKALLICIVFAISVFFTYITKDEKKMLFAKLKHK